MFNDFLLVIGVYTFMTFTDWGPSEQMKYDIGWCMLIIVAIAIVVNFMFVTSNFFRLMKLRAIRWYKILQREFNKRFGEKLMSYDQFRKAKI